MSDALHKAIDGLSRKLAEFTQTSQLAQAPAAVISNAKLAILDCLGVSVFATQQEIGDCLRKFAKANVSPGNCSVWGMKSKPAYATRHSSTARLRMVSITTTAIIRPLTLSRLHSLQPKVSTQRGDKLWKLSSSAAKCGRRWIASSRPPFERHRPGRTRLALQWHSRPHRRGLLGEPKLQVKSAANTRGNRSFGRRLRRAHARRRHHGQAISLRSRRRHGRNSALLAQAGFSSDETALEGRYGLLEAVGPLSDEILESLVKNLGVEWDLAHSLRIKPFASCTQPIAGLKPCCDCADGKKSWRTMSKRSSAIYVLIRWCARGQAAATKAASACLSAWR